MTLLVLMLDVLVLTLDFDNTHSVYHQRPYIDLYTVFAIIPYGVLKGQNTERNFEMRYFIVHVINVFMLNFSFIIALHIYTRATNTFWMCLTVPAELDHRSKFQSKFICHASVRRWHRSSPKLLHRFFFQILHVGCLGQSNTPRSFLAFSLIWYLVGAKVQKATPPTSRA